MNASIHKQLTITGLLIAFAILIPIIMPLKVIIPPASYTLASHVPIFLAMFLSRKMTAAVVAGSTLGFLVAGFPLVIVMRAASHIFFALAGSYYLKYHANTLSDSKKFFVFNLICGVIHAVGEVLACLLFYTTTSFPNINIIYFVFVLVGGGTIIHSIVDGYISIYIYKLIPPQFLKL